MDFSLGQIAKGENCTIFALIKNEKCLTHEFLKTLHKSNIASYKKIMSTLIFFAEEGLNNNEKFKRLTDDIYEFKSGQVRILCFFKEQNIVLCTHGFMKKTRKTPAGEISRALNMKNDFYKSEE